MITENERAKDLGMLVFSLLEELACAEWVEPALAADFLCALSELEVLDSQAVAAAQVADVLAQALRVREENLELLTVNASFDR